MGATDGDQAENAIEADELDWKAEEILLAVDRLGGTADLTEIKEESGIDSRTARNYRVKGILSEGGFVDYLQPESEDGGSKAKIVTLLNKGSEVVEILREQREAEDLGVKWSLGERVERIESKLNSEHGAWGHEKAKQYEGRLDLTRLIRDFLIEEYGDEFKNYVRENAD